MEIHQLRMFLYVATERSFRRAAEKMNMTQPPLSRQIQLLEHELGTPLFKRSTRRVELTDAGNVLLNEAVKIINLTEEVASRVKLTAQGDIGEIKIGIFSLGVTHQLPAYLKMFRKLKPGANVRLFNMSKNEQVAALRKNDIDLGFCRFAVGQKGLCIGNIKTEKYLVAINASDPLCEYKQITLADLENKPMILYPSSSLSGMAQHVFNAFATNNIDINVSNYCQDIITSLLLVSGGYGSCITTTWAENIVMPEVIYKPLHKDSLTQSPLNYIYREDNSSKLLHDFIEIIKSLS